MKVLLDTNIIIHREASKVINQDIGVLFNWLDKLHYQKCIHPITIEEINKNSNKDMVSTMQIKLTNYNVLKTVSQLNPNVANVSKSIDGNQNDFNDTSLINELYNDRVDLLISEDKKIHYKAARLGISDKVFRIDSFLEKVAAENPDLIDYKVLSVRKELFGRINLADTFFDSFRDDYIGFDKWFNKKSDEHAYICLDNSAMVAFLYIKLEAATENYENISPRLPPKKRLKIGTLKVISNGYKIGERFLKIIFDNARQYKTDEVYVTIFDKRPEQLRLIALLEEYGFEYYGEKETSSGIEKVFVKNMLKSGDLETPRKTFPRLSKDANVYIVPIRPEYHTELFPDSILRTESPGDFVENEPYRNSISKVYISHSHTRDLRPGDVLVFYRSGGIHVGVATTIGIVENIVTDLTSAQDLIDVCRKRTVLNEQDLYSYWDRYPKNRPFVINFLYAYSFKRRMNLKAMLDLSILPSMDYVKTITPIGLDALKKLIIVSGI